MVARVRIAIAWLALAAFSAAACSTNDDVPAPAIAGVQPDHGAAGIAVMVSGSSLCQQPSTDTGDIDPLACAHTGTVLFGTVPAVVLSYTDTLVTTEVPALASGAVDLTVSVAGRTSNSLGFVVE